MDPSVIALPLPQAIETLEAAGKPVSRVIATGPAALDASSRPPRVIRERETSDGVELTVAVPIDGPRRAQAD